MSDRINYYLAAPFVRKDEARTARLLIAQELGWVCTSRWIDNHVSPLEELDENVAREESETDLQDVAEADIMILLNLEKSEGKMFEAGYAFALDIPVAIIGTPTSIFHHLDGFGLFDSVEQFVRAYKVANEEGNGE